MKRLLLTIAFILASTITLVAQEDVKGVAILKPVDEVGNVSPGVKLNLRATLAYAINHMDGYEAYTRINMAQIMDEHKFQRTGLVSNNEIKKIGKATGAKYILIAEVAYFDDKNITVTASIVDIETTRLVATADPEISPVDPEEMRESSIKIARSLLSMGNVSINDSHTTKRSSGSAAIQRGQDFSETALGLNMRMIYVEGGTFSMGCTSDEEYGCDEDEITRVTTVSSFYIGMLEVTQSQWEKVMGTTIYQQQESAEAAYTYGTGSNYPMYYVNWNEAKMFCARLSRETGKNYSLPTEAEWEYAARGGNKNEGTTYSGSQKSDEVAWFGGKTTHPCGAKHPNALGVYDMSGNVSEWCEDIFGEYLNYDNNNPKGASTGSWRVVRGGDFESGETPVWQRQSTSQGVCDYQLGFRVVLHQ